jgi:DNA polymerase type B, organellar and viral
VDIETYSLSEEDVKGKQIAYSAGFMDYKKQVKMFYVQEGDADNMVVVRMIEELLVERHNGCTFYVHNLARFDSRLILAALGLMKEVNARLWGREMNEIFKIRISKKIGKKSVNVVFLDSFYQLPLKLDVLGIKFNTNTKKSLFPHKFVNKDNLFYKGEVPAIEFFDGKIDKKDYSDICQSGV